MFIFDNINITKNTISFLHNNNLKHKYVNCKFNNVKLSNWKIQ